MKKLLLILSLLSFVLTSCEKEDKDEIVVVVDPVAELQSQVLGTWIEQGYKTEYYDENNNKVYEVNEDGQFIENVVLDENYIVWDYADYSPNWRGIYQVYLRDGKKYMNFGYISDEVEITALTPNMMVWKEYNPGGDYYNAEQGELIFVDHHVRVFTFVR